MVAMRAIAGLMIAPMLYLGTGVTERLWAAAQRPAAAEPISSPHPPRFARYTIDFDGIRWLKTVGFSVTTYLVDRVQPFQQVLEDRVGGAVTATYVHLDDLVAAAFAGTPGTRFYHYDGQMSTRKLTDPVAAVTDEYTFDAWGLTLHATGTTPNNYLYTGEQFDPNIAFQYNRARYLNHTTGRFISRDQGAEMPFEPPALHRYLYAHGDPLSLLDPSGEAAEGFWDPHNFKSIDDVGERIRKLTGEKLRSPQEICQWLADYLAALEADRGVALNRGASGGTIDFNLISVLNNTITDVTALISLFCSGLGGGDVKVIPFPRVYPVPEYRRDAIRYSAESAERQLALQLVSSFGVALVTAGVLAGFAYLHSRIVLTVSVRLV
jgi:RHS repeat-associated protein